MLVILIKLIRYFLYCLLATTVFFQMFYLFFTLGNVKKRFKFKNDNPQKCYADLSIVIPVFNSESTIRQTLKSIDENKIGLIKKIIIVNDHSTDGSMRVIKDFISSRNSKNRFIFVDFSGKTSGKVEAINEAIRVAQSKYILLIDADIILRRDALESLYQTHIANNNFCTSCLIYPYKNSVSNSLISQVICNDRLYRQNILKPARSFFDVANFPGSVGVIKSADYKKYIKKGFLEDLKATYKIMEENKKISIIPFPLAFEIERRSLQGLFLQRARWTIGSAECLEAFFRAILNSRGFIKKLLILSYPIMYHIQYYLISLGLLLFIIRFEPSIFNIPLVLYFFQILMSARIGRSLFRSSFLGICLHCLIFPIIITLSLFSAVYFLVDKKSFYFNSKILFKRV